MRRLTSVIIVGLAALASPMAAYADCSFFSPDGNACATPKSKAQIDVGKLAWAQDQARRMLGQVQVPNSVPTDCRMIKPVDPKFASNMPVQTPDPKVKLPIRTVPVPSCGKPDSDERR